MAKALFKSKGVEFEEINVTGDRRLRAWLLETTGQHTVPQIFIGDVSFGGYSDVHALDQAGELDAHLE